MRLTRLILYSSILLLFFGNFSPVVAQGEFSTSMDSTYTILPTGQTHVKKVFGIRNNLSTVYAKKYGIELSSNRITNITIYDESGTIPANIVQTDNKTTIGIEFSDKVVGKDKIRSFTVEYTDPDTAIVNGQILEVYIPRTSDPASFENYDITLRVPKQFGEAAITNPSNYSLTQEADYQILTFRNQGKEEGVTALFGKQQFYQFELTYHLQNPTGNRGVIQIALPPDTRYQKIVYDDIQPRPDGIKTDDDGNWIATFIMESSQEQTVVAKGTAIVYLKPTVDMPVSQPKAEHTKAAEFWEVSHPNIQSLASKYQTPRTIYDYVVNNLNYNYARLDAETIRLGAVEAVLNPNNAVCQEFTDVFVSLARANNIPARQATGYAFTQNSTIRPLSLVQDILHAWPEYYDQQTQEWIPVDPTWANTTGGVDYFSQLDFSHVVFAYQGINSQTPYPAGSYKRSQVETKDIQIEIASAPPDLTPQVVTQIINPLSSKFGLAGQHSLSLTNTGGHALYNFTLQLDATDDIQLQQPVVTVSKILPFQTIQAPITIKSRQLFRPQQGTLYVTIGNHTSALQVTGTPQLYLTHQPYVLAGIGGLVGLLVILFVGILIWRKRRS